MTIRRTPHDFLVVERLSPAYTAALRDRRATDAPCALFELTKTSLSTPEATSRLARELKLRQDSVCPAGLKDKHAHTVQHVTAACTSTPPSELAGPGWSARLIGFAPAPISAQAIDHNHFEIIVRDLSPEPAREMDHRAQQLREGNALVVLNYFGDQRFGSARHGEGFVARHLIEGEFEHALRLSIASPARKDTGAKRAFTRAAAKAWGDFAAMLPALPRCPERRAVEHLVTHPGDFRGAFAALPAFFQFMCVEAFQSHLWNDIARRLAERIAREGESLPARLPTPDNPRVHRREQATLLRTPDDFGEMLFPVARVIDPAWLDVDVPLLAPTSALHEPWKQAATDTLTAEGLTLADLRIPGLKRPYFGEAPRRLFVRAESFTQSAPEPDELASPASGRRKRTLIFNLPRGAYATVVLRALGQ